MSGAYHRKNKILTEREIKFYKQLKAIADKKNLVIFAQVRLADVIWVPRKWKMFRRYFNTVKAKHIDFVLCDADTFEIKCLIELDDKTHQFEVNHSNDLKKNDIVKSSGHHFIRCNPNDPSAHERVCNIL